MANFALLLLRHTAFEKSGQSVSVLEQRETALRSMLTAIHGINFYAYSPTAFHRLLQTVIMLMWGQSALISVAKKLDLANILECIRDAIDDDEKDVISLIQYCYGMIEVQAAV